MKLFAAFLGCALLCAGASPAAPQKLPWQSADTGAANGQQSVHFLYPQQVTVAAGKPQRIELHFRIIPGLHINSHTPTQKGLIRTDLLPADSSGVKVASVDFPPGSDFSFPADPTQKLSIYSGEFVLKVHILAPRGNHLLQSSLRYQACDMSTCFPPRTVPVAVDVIAQ